MRVAGGVLLGPLAWPSWVGRAVGVLLVVLLTLLTQVGGLTAWPALGLAARTRWPVRAALLLVVGAHGAALPVVPPLARLGGRVALPCIGDGPLQPRSLVYCIGHRRYVRPALAAEIAAIADAVARKHPGTVVRYLDGGFPFRGLPLLPHLSHGDGRKLDLALLYTDAEGRPVDGGGSFIGYFGYVPLPEKTQPACPPSLVDLRWDMDWLQPLLAPRLDVARTASLVETTARRAAIGKILLEPHIQRRLGVSSDKLRFQGCRAARHDDHVHIQLR